MSGSRKTRSVFSLRYAFADSGYKYQKNTYLISPYLSPIDPTPSIILRGHLSVPDIVAIAAIISVRDSRPLIHSLGDQRKWKKKFDTKAHPLFRFNFLLNASAFTFHIPRDSHQVRLRLFRSRKISKRIYRGCTSDGLQDFPAIQSLFIRSESINKG
jgi:hypothetical protein